jgi:hypothetical protein
MQIIYVLTLLSILLLLAEVAVHKVVAAQAAI